MQTIEHVGRRLSARFIKSQLHGAGPFELRLPGCVITGDLRIEKKAFTHVDLTGCHCQGTITFADCNLPSHGLSNRARFKMRGARVDGGLRIRRGYKSDEHGLSTWADIDLTDSQVLSSIEMDGVDCNRLALVQVRSGGSLKIRRRDPQPNSDTVLHSVLNGDLDAHGLEVEGDVLLRGVTMQQRAIFSNAQIGGVFSAQAWEPNSRDADPVPVRTSHRSPKTSTSVKSSLLNKTTIKMGLWLTRATIRGGVLLQGIIIEDQLDARFAQLGGLDLSSRLVKRSAAPFTVCLSEVLRARMAVYRSAFKLDFGAIDPPAEWMQAPGESTSSCELESKLTIEAQERFASQENQSKSCKLIESDGAAKDTTVSLFHLGQGYSLLWKIEESSKARPQIEFQVCCVQSSNRGQGKIGQVLRMELMYPEGPRAFVDLHNCSSPVHPVHFSITPERSNEAVSFSKYVGDQSKRIWIKAPRRRVGITEVKGEVQLDSAVVSGDLILSGAIINGGLRLPGATIIGKFDATSISASPNSPNTAESKYIPTLFGILDSPVLKFRASIHAENVTIGKSFQIAGCHARSGINLMGANIGGNVYFSGDGTNRTIIGTAIDDNRRVYSLRLSAGKIGGNVLLHGTFLASGLSVENSEIDGDLSGISTWVEATEDTAERRTYIGQGYWDKHERASLHLNGVRIKGDADFRGAFLEGGVLCEAANIDGFLGLGSIDRATSRSEKSGLQYLPKPGTEDERYASCFIGPAQDTLVGAFSVILTNSEIAGSVDCRGAIIRCGIYAGHSKVLGDLLLQRFLPRTEKQPSATTCIGPGLGAGWQLSLRDDNQSEAALFTPNAQISGHIHFQGAILASGWSGSGTRVSGSILAAPFDSNNPIATRTILAPGRRRDSEFHIRLPSAYIKGDVEWDFVSFRLKGLSRYEDEADESPILKMEGAQVGGILSLRTWLFDPLFNARVRTPQRQERSWPVEALQNDFKGSVQGAKNCLYILPPLVHSPHNWLIVRSLGLLAAAFVSWFLLFAGLLHIVLAGQGWFPRMWEDLRFGEFDHGLISCLCILLAFLIWWLHYCRCSKYGSNANFEVEGMLASGLDVSLEVLKEDYVMKACLDEGVDSGQCLKERLRWSRGISLGYQFLIWASRPSGHAGFLGTDHMAGVSVAAMLMVSAWAAVSCWYFAAGDRIVDTSSVPLMVPFAVLFGVSFVLSSLMRLWQKRDYDGGRRRGESGSSGGGVVGEGKVQTDKVGLLWRQCLGKWLAGRRRASALSRTDGKVTGTLLFLASCDHNESTYAQVEKHARDRGDHVMADRVSLHWQARDITRNFRRITPLDQIPGHVLMGHGVRGWRVLGVIVSLFLFNVAFVASDLTHEGGALSRWVCCQVATQDSLADLFGCSETPKSRANVEEVVSLAAAPLVPVGVSRDEEGNVIELSSRITTVRFVMWNGEVAELRTRMGVESVQTLIRSIAVFMFVIIGYAFFRQSPRLMKLRGYNS